MNTKKSKYWTTTTLVFIPLFLLYLHFSDIIYHTHIFTNGESITHAHPFKNCKNDNSDKSKNQSEKEVIVFHSLIIDLTDNVPEFVYEEIRIQQCERLILTSNTYYSFIFSPDTAERAPPVIYS